MVKTVKFVRVGVVLCAVALVAAACSSSSTASSKPASSGGTGGTAASTTPIPVNVELYSGSFYTYLADLAQVQGFYAKNGLDATMLNITGGGAVAFSALASGSADIAMGDLPLAGPFIQKGVALTAVSGAVSSGWEIVGAKGTTVPTSFPDSIRALAGKNVGVVALGTSSYYYLKELVAAAGMSPTSINYVAIGGTPAAAAAALASDRVAAALVTPDLAYYFTNVLHQQLIFNYNDPASLKSAGGLWKTRIGKSGGYMWATDAWISSHPGGVQRYQLAMEEADVWMHNPSNLPKVLSDLSAQQNLPSFATGAAQKPYFESILPYVISYVPAGSAPAIRNFWVQAGLLPTSFPSPSTYFSSTISTSSAQVVANVAKAGQAKLGTTAS